MKLHDVPKMFLIGVNDLKISKSPGIQLKNKTSNLQDENTLFFFNKRQANKDRVGQVKAFFQLYHNFIIQVIS